jgi:peptidoglycan/LPS O-acetylase OafA/YrhL
MGLAYRREIDGLRAIAVLGVVLYHAGAMPAAGYAGVDIFFVISGYLITLLLVREHAGSGRIDLVAFYARRARRIFPAALVLILLVLIATALVLPAADFKRVGDSAVCAALFVSNFYFQNATGGYFDPSSDSMPLLHLWSLSVEEQFYLLWPLLLLGLLRFRVRLVPALAILAIASFGLAEWLIRIDPHAAFYQMPARFWELAAGGLVAVMPRRRLPASVIWLGLVIAVGACFLPMAHFPGGGALPAVAGAALLLAGINAGATNPLLASRPMVWIGLISYSLYLWHWPLLAIYRATTLGDGSLQVRLSLCAVAVALAFASYRYVETPFRRKASNRRALIYGVGSLAAVAISASVFAKHVEPTAADFAAADFPSNRAQCHYIKGEARFPRTGCASVPGIRPTVAIWGDSMALAWQPLAWELARRQHASAIDYSMDACKPAVGYLVEGGEFCRDFNAKVLERVRNMDTVVIAGRWSVEFLDSNPEAASAGLRATLDGLARVRRVIVLGPTPEMRDEVPRCLRANDPAACAIPRREFDAGNRLSVARIRALVATHPNAEYVAPGDWLCNAASCPAVKDGVALYWDRHHVSSTAARKFAAEMVR